MGQPADSRNQLNVSQDLAEALEPFRDPTPEVRRTLAWMRAGQNFAGLVVPALLVCPLTFLVLEWLGIEADEPIGLTAGLVLLGALVLFFVVMIGSGLLYHRLLKKMSRRSESRKQAFLILTIGNILRDAAKLKGDAQRRVLEQAFRSLEDSDPEAES